MRSNRYHYATRFARHLPVIFVQPFLKKEEDFFFEETEIPSITILHITEEYGQRQTTLLNEALKQQGFKKPMLWIYNFNFIDYILNSPSLLKIYHATEDYLSPEFPHLNRDILRQVLANTDILVSVSPGVRKSYLENGGFKNEDLLLPNGCDYTFWAPPEKTLQHPSWNFDPKTAFYQGNINRRIDFSLLNGVISQMPDWEFRFCGVVNGSHKEWEQLVKQHQNLKFYGRLTPEEMRSLAFTCAVGIIPFIQSDLITQKYLPLKSFEYLASGLPVVSVPIEALKEYDDVFTLASTIPEFIKGLEKSNILRYNSDLMKRRLAVAKQQDYNSRFETLLAKISELLTKKV